MQLSMKLGVILSAIFAAVCYGFAIVGFSSLHDIADPVVQADGRGFAWFWTFLGTVAAAIGALTLWIMKKEESK